MQQLGVNIVGGGLAGCEAAWQCLNAGLEVTLYEMRPHKMTPAHKGGDLAELVCSNSLKSTKPDSASGQLKYEMRALNSIIVAAAYDAAVPAGDALAVDRELFSRAIEQHLSSYEKFHIVRSEIESVPRQPDDNQIWIIASGPLTSSALMQEIVNMCGAEDSAYFYDAIAPTLAADSIDYDKVFWCNRYDPEGHDYLNIPLSKDEYLEFIADVRYAAKVPLRDFEDQKYFESCLPIEVMVERGEDTLRFGPMKPVGILDPKTGEQPYAVIQLRKENLAGSMLSMVGFQTKMTWTEQARVFRKLPGLADAEFLRLGSIHRNSYLRSPLYLNPDLSFKAYPQIFLAGQITGVEGYLESAAMGLLAGRFAAGRCLQREFFSPPRGTLLGALLSHVTTDFGKNYQPMNANLGLLPVAVKQRRESKMQRKARQVLKAKEEFDTYLAQATEGG
jgi:methylenetetrahydrofolate--tRNA-(uracil-5-)-methyltransferase